MISSFFNIFNNKCYYFDNNATTLIYDKEVYNIVNDWLSCANPSNTLHLQGQEANKQLEKCRQIVADDLGVESNEIYFTGSATEANNIIIQGVINKNLDKYNNITIITSTFEHPSVLNIFKKYENNYNVNVVYIPLDLDTESNNYGSVDTSAFIKALNSYNNIALVSIMFANNESGAINNIKLIGQQIRNKNISQNDIYTFFHCDCTQIIGKHQIKPKELFIDSITFSGHKFHSPKGVGCLYINNKNNKCPICGICFGGEQEETIRPGTENIAYISALTHSLINVHKNRKEKNKKLTELKLYLMVELNKLNCILITPKHSLNNTIMFILPPLKICNRQFCNIISKKYGICLGTSSACQTNKYSHVLSAMNIDENYKLRVIRLSTSDYTTFGECEYLIDKIKEMIEEYKN